MLYRSMLNTYYVQGLFEYIIELYNYFCYAVDEKKIFKKSVCF
jgi:hypothetical protein